MDDKFNFGIVGTEELPVTDGGGSFLFADSSEATFEKEVEPKKEEAAKVEETPTPKDTFSVDPPKSVLFEQDEEEDEVPTTPVEDSEPSEEAEDNKEPLNPFGDLSKDLVELGIFSQEEGEEEITTPEQFKEKWEQEKKKGASQEISSFLSQFGKKHIDAFNAIYVNGVDPEVYFQKQASIESFANANIEDDFVQENIVKSYYRKLGWKEERIEAKVAKLRDYDDLKDEAETAQEHLVRAEQEQLAQIEANKTQELQAKAQQEQHFQQSINQILSDKLASKEFDGLPVNNKIAGEVFDTMVTKKWSLPNGERLSDFDKFLMDLKRPENFETAVKIALLKNSGFDFSKVKAKAISKESTELFKSVRVKEKVAKRSTAPNAFTF